MKITRTLTHALGILSLVAFLCGFPSTIQGGIRWLSTEYDFGTWPEVAGPKTGEVKFVNDGPEPTAINRVRLTCGCTSETHTEGIVNPGDTATVSFSYNPKGRPGRFEKSIRVYTGKDNDLTTINMRGTVIGAPETLQADYPVEAGALRLDSRNVDFGKVRHGTSRHHFVVLYNQWKDSIRPYWSNVADAVDISLSTPVIPPGELATMSIYLNTRDEENMGPVKYDFTITSDSLFKNYPTSFSISADITPDTKDMTPEEIALAPRAECMPRFIEIGAVNISAHRDAASYPLSFTISNEGVSELHVARVYSRDAALKVKRFPAILKKGKSGKVEATVDLRKIPVGPFSFKIEVLSDDPLHPIRTVSVSGEIEK